MISYGNKIEKSFETLFFFISNITKYLQKKAILIKYNNNKKSLDKRAL